MILFSYKWTQEFTPKKNWSCVSRASPQSLRVSVCVECRYRCMQLKYFIKAGNDVLIK